MTEHDAAEVRRRLLAAVPELPAPADRLAQVRRRVVRARTQRFTGAGVALVGVLAAFGFIVNADPLPGSDTATYGSPSPSGYPFPDWPSADPRPSGSTPWTPPPYRPPGSEYSPGRPPTGTRAVTLTCPAVVDLMTIPAATTYPPRGRTWTQVVACRYRHEAFDLSSPNGQATRIRGPVTASASAVELLQVLIEVPAPMTHGASAGCTGPSPTRDLSIDVIFAGDATGPVKTYFYVRITCANPEPNGTNQILANALDALLGVPY